MSAYEKLKHACELYGQRGVARKIQRSPTAVNQTLKGIYPNPSAILDLCEKAFKTLIISEIECPYLGKIHVDTCRRYLGWAKASVIRSDRLYRSVKANCPTCKQGRKDGA